MVESYSRDILKVVVAQICQTIGWHAIHSTAIELLTDVLRKYIHELGHTAHRYGEQFGHTIPTLDDVGLAFRDMGISVPELEEYVEYVASVPCAIEVPKYPIEKESHLNLLKPGSREVVTRPVHIHEHLPAMHPELEEEEYSVKQSPLSVDTSLGNETGSPPQSSPKTSLFKRPGDPVSLESPSLKRARLMLEEEGRPLREISSVMMTTSGFLSPAREGKLPEARTPIQPSDSRSNSPQPLSYPAVPPEVKGEKKIKKNPPKTGVDGIKKLLDKENNKAKESGNGDIQVTDDDDPNVKKLVSMKELSKLKALKSGALKMMAQNSSNTQSGINKTKPVKNKVILPNFIQNVSLAQQKPTKKVEEKPSKPDKSNISASPNLFKVLTFSEKVAEKTKAPDPNLVDGKLTSEPDKQKLNIFKKISKVKEEKSEPIDVVNTSRESSPTLVVSDQENNRQREVRWAQISETIEAVIQRSREIPVEPSGKLQTETLDASDTELFQYDDDLSPPATPTMPRTPEIMLPSRKAEKAEIKKRKRDKNKDKKESKERSLKSPSPKRFKSENNEPDYILPDKSKSPEVDLPSRDEIISQTQQPPVFPFFPHFPPAPGLIPPPIGPSLFPRFSLPMVKAGGGLIPPHPAMPNLPIPPPLFMQPRLEDREPPRIRIPTPPPISHPPSLSPVMLPTPPSSSSPLKSELNEKVHTSTMVKEKEKSIEKEKKKEHKKDKKDKIKKKKDKKDKSKNKEKGEKKKDKSEKKERDKEKSKEKREKKEKKREKELQREEKEKSEGSVPKITFKLGPLSPQQPPTPEPPTHRKIVIKPVLKKSEEPVKPVEPVEVKKERERSPSPELARISALVTRPPKPKSLSKTQPLAPFAHSIQPLAEPTPQPPPPVLPQPSISTQGKKSANTTNSSSPKIKQKDVPKKARDNEVVKDTVAFYFLLLCTGSGAVYHCISGTNSETKVQSGKAGNVPLPYSGESSGVKPKKRDNTTTKVDNEGNQVWICPACGGQDDGSPMIGCDGCDAWYHWVCVGIQVPPDSNDWFCRVCIGKKDELVGEKKKKIRKKKTVG